LLRARSRPNPSRWKNSTKCFRSRRANTPRTKVAKSRTLSRSTSCVVRFVFPPFFLASYPRNLLMYSIYFAPRSPPCTSSPHVLSLQPPSCAETGRTEGTALPLGEQLGGEGAAGVCCERGCARLISVRAGVDGRGRASARVVLCRLPSLTSSDIARVSSTWDTSLERTNRTTLVRTFAIQVVAGCGLVSRRKFGWRGSDSSAHSLPPRFSTGTLSPSRTRLPASATRVNEPPSIVQRKPGRQPLPSTRPPLSPRIPLRTRPGRPRLKGGQGASRQGGM
jgi:hypothetical protein